MIKLIAVDAADGWGVISEDDQLFLLTPPYPPDDMKEVSMKYVDTMITRGGLDYYKGEFKSIDDVVLALKMLYVESKEAQGILTPSKEKLNTFLKHVGENTWHEFFRQARKEGVLDLVLQDYNTYYKE